VNEKTLQRLRDECILAAQQAGDLRREHKRAHVRALVELWPLVLFAAGFLTLVVYLGVIR